MFNLRPFTHHRSRAESFMISRNFFKIYSGAELLLDSTDKKRNL